MKEAGSKAKMKIEAQTNNQSPMMVTLLNVLPAVVWKTNSFVIFYLPIVAIMNLLLIY